MVIDPAQFGSATIVGPTASASVCHGSQRELGFCGQPHNRCSKEKSMKLTSFVLLAALIAGASIQVQAQRGERENSQVAQACKAELQQLCQGQKGQQAEQCLKNNESKLNAQCKGAINKTPKQ
jgi:uncharacterized protein HemX